MLSISGGIHKTEIRLEGEELFVGSDFEVLKITENGLFTTVHLAYKHEYEAIVGGFFEEAGEALLVIDNTNDKIIYHDNIMEVRKQIDRLNK